jgi:hypothetical protein
MFDCRYRSKQKGMTLTELSFAFAVICLISAFTIPKIISSNHADTRKAVFRETLSSLHVIMQQGSATGDLRIDNTSTYFISRLNTIKVCQNSASEGCAVVNGGTGEDFLPGAILANGSSVFGLDNCCADNGFVIDYNGPKPPNLVGQDQIRMEMCLGPQTCWGTLYQPGEIFVGSWGNGDNQALYNTILDI